MDVLLLGTAAIVLIALTVWIVWRPPQTADGAGSADEASQIPPRGDQFEDQYTSATADLSAGGIALATASQEPAASAPRAESRPRTGARQGAETTTIVEPAAPSAYQTAGEPWSEPSMARERAMDIIPAAPLARQPGPRPQAIGLGAAAALAIGGAVGGAWLYARWQEQQRKRPVNRLRRLFR